MNKEIDISRVVLRTERLILRAWREDDLADFYEYAKVDGVGQMAGWTPHKSIEESRQILTSFIQNKRTFALEHNGKVIGSLGVERYNEDNFPELACLQGREIGYVLSKDYWGKGLMPEAVRAVIDYLFGVEELDFILVGHFDWNSQSARVIEKCGFSFIKNTEYATRYGTVEKSVQNILYNPQKSRRMIKPKSLKRGDKVAVVSLSSGMLGEKQFIHKYNIAKERLENDYGLRVVAMPNALKGIDYLYRHPEARAQDLMDAFADTEIKAVFNAIGGDDTIRLLPYIDFDVIRRNPKIFTGFSDTTTNHFMMYKAGVVSYYGLSIMCDIAEYVRMNEYTKQAMENILFSPVERLDIPCSDFCSYEEDRIRWNESNVNDRRPVCANTGYEILQGKGKVTGELLGGCIDVFLELLGTELFPSANQWRGKLLLIETSESNMTEDTLCWILRNLHAQGILNVINGIVVGKPAFKDKYDSYKAEFKKVVGFEADRPDLPILYNVNVGHTYPIGVFPLGLKYEIDCENRSFALLEPGTIL